MSQINNRIQNAGLQTVTPVESIRVDIAAFRKSYETAHPLLRQIVDASFDRQNPEGQRGIELQLTRIAKDFCEYPLLSKAAAQSHDVRCAIIMAEAVLDKLRKFTARRIVHHTLRGAEMVVEFFGVNAVLPIVTMLIHDMREDGHPALGITNENTIKPIFGDDVALGGKILTIEDRQRSTNRTEDIGFKKEAKNYQTEVIKRLIHRTPEKAYIAAIKAFDNYDGLRSDAKDFREGKLFIKGEDVHKTIGTAFAGTLKDFVAKWKNLRWHHESYRDILRETGTAMLNGGKIDYAKIGAKLESKYSATETEVTDIKRRGDVTAINNALPINKVMPRPAQKIVAANVTRRDWVRIAAGLFGGAVVTGGSTVAIAKLAPTRTEKLLAGLQRVKAAFLL